MPNGRFREIELKYAEFAERPQWAVGTNRLD